MAHIGEIKIGGQDYSVEVDERGVFSVDAGPAGNITAKSMDELREKMNISTRKASARVSIKAMRIDDQGGTAIAISSIEFTGIHGRTGHLLYRDESGKAQTMEGYSRKMREICRPMSAEERTEAARLLAAANAARTAAEDYLGPFAFEPNIRAVVQTAINKAAGIPAGDDDDDND